MIPLKLRKSTKTMVELNNAVIPPALQKTI